MWARRVIPAEIRQHLDPFALFEWFYIEPVQGFGTHPHRGFELVSYMLEGGMDQGDLLGHLRVARPGDAMRITTGSGLHHSEFPAGDESCSGLQLWVNLPCEAKDVGPSYEDSDAEDLPTRETDGVTVTTVVGDDDLTEADCVIVDAEDGETLSVTAESDLRFVALTRVPHR